MQAPCKDCPDRVPGCHSACEKYAAYKAKKEQAAQRKYLDNIMPDGASKTYWRSVRRRISKG